MADDRPLVAVTFRMEPERVAELFGDEVRARSLAGLPEEERARTVAAADALLVWNWGRELRRGEGPTLGARLVQLMSAGADQLPFDQLPPKAIVASNVGAYAEPMAEHALAMALALLKQLPQRHAELAEGVFDQARYTHWLRGAVCGVLGFGGIGKATGRLMRAVGLRVHAINTSGRTDEPVDFVGTLDDLDAVLAASDVLVIALPLTRRTHGLIGARELGLMKPTAVLVNVARGAIVDEAALYEHLRTHPDFSAGIDTWWVEPFGSGEFRVDHPFFELPNLLGSPHNSGVLPGVMDEATRRAAANVLRFLRGEPVSGILQPEDYTGARQAELR
ncbi:MAG TPA: 2-hydroxyacid dehydrogenase [Actinomycetes bacterium]|nr:2-hydroxyacid dehydrogenase [Actinomycetes bacterium]